MRGGYLTHRPGIRRRPMVYLNESLQSLFSTGYFQGSGIYQGPRCTVSLIASISGRLVKIDIGNTAMASEISIAGDLGNANIKKVYFQQAENLLFVQDTDNVPIIYNGATSRRSDVVNKEVPTGGPMAYGKGRLAVAIGKSYVMGDIVGGNGTAENVKNFTENDFINEGGSFYVPSQQGDCAPITALAYGSNLDTSLGEGDLMVFTQGSIFAFSAPVDRTVWKNLQYPIQRFALLDFGAMGQDSVTTVNGDLFFRSQDGIRSFIFARRDFSQSWANTPISGEMDRALNYDNERLLYAGSAVNFDNRLLTTVGPTLHERGVVHRGLAAMDFELVSTMRGRTSPAWEGVWTGVKLLQIHRFRLSGQMVCYAFGVDDTDTIGLWEITTDERFDNGSTPIDWIFETREFNYGAPMARQQLMSGELWIENVLGKLTINSRFRSNGRSCWHQWHRYETCVDKGTCDAPDDYCGIRPIQPGVRNRIGFAQAGNACDADGPVAIGCGHQARIEVKGSCTIKRLRVSAEPKPEGVFGEVTCS